MPSPTLRTSPVSLTALSSSTSVTMRRNQIRKEVTKGTLTTMGAEGWLISQTSLVTVRDATLRTVDQTSNLGEKVAMVVLIAITVSNCKDSFRQQSSQVV